MRNKRITLVVVAAAGLFHPGCSKSSSVDEPAGVPPLPANATASAPAFAASRPDPTGPALRALLPPSEARRQALEGALGIRPPGAEEPEAVPAVVDESKSISGTITLPPANRAKVARGDVMFLAARRAGGPPGPGSMLAVQKLTAEDFPMRFSISDRDAMIPGVPFEGQMSITVRVDKDGDAMTRRKGDVFGQAENVKVGSQKVVISLDKVQTEDRTLGEPGAAMGGMLPAGHP
jgi:hypothetical protein